MSQPAPALDSGDVLSGRTSQSEEDAVYSKVNWHIMPIILLAYILSFLDRINVGYTQLQMKQSLASPTPFTAWRRHFLHQLFATGGA